MEIKNKVSLWLGYFTTKKQFFDFMKINYSEDGEYILSKFQEYFQIKHYDIDSSEIDWIDKECYDISTLLQGFSNDYEIIPNFQRLLVNEKIINYNSIVLLYNSKYENNITNYQDNTHLMKYIGCVDVNL